MACTVVGVFADTESARGAAVKLLETGVAKDQLDVYAAPATLPVTPADDRLGYYFTNLFDEEEVGRKHRFAGSRGIVVSVHLQHDENVKAITAVMDEAGALNVDDVADQYFQDYRDAIAGMHMHERAADLEPLAEYTDKAYANLKFSRLIMRGAGTAWRLRS